MRDTVKPEAQVGTETQCGSYCALRHRIGGSKREDSGKTSDRIQSRIPENIFPSITGRGAQSFLETVILQLSSDERLNILRLRVPNPEKLRTEPSERFQKRTFDRQWEFGGVFGTRRTVKFCLSSKPCARLFAALRASIGNPT
ncbi:Hypothetical predicted protein [Olea europaea subsp. europaea]|uniref:Uncharacterized protein n=1 Tax=Olea europaea subsp. europaea TaxID=158383 RepID=A0A8S0VL00_OLEEU|nr:Hypothetical predicted protein [Olea europaea subsp. europaea]